MERHIDGQQAHKKMFNIANYQRNANENYNEVSPDTDGLQAHEKRLNIANYQRNANENYNDGPPHTGQNGHHPKAHK